MDSASLVEKIGAIRKQSLSVHGGSRYFVPYDQLLEILTEDSIRAVISTIKEIRDDQHQLFVTLIKERFPKIFGILVYNGHEQHLCKFLYRLEYDSRRYFSRTDLEFLDKRVGDSFFEHQWEFIPVVLEKGALHRELYSSHILPFLEDTRIGGGGFGEVFKVKLDARCQLLVDIPGQQDAVYIVRKQIHASLVAEQERSVLEVVRKIQHPNIVELLGSYNYQNNLNLLFPLADTDLRALFRSNRRMSPEVVCSGAYGLADALQSIHNLTFVSNGVESRRIGYHHDLRPANILLRGDIFFIADFGLAKLKKEDETSKSRLRGGQEDYLAPEAFDEIEWQNGNVGRAIDVWAFGCIVAELATYISGGSVEIFRETRKLSHRHGDFNMTDCAFHLSRKLRPAVDTWLHDLVSETSPPEVSDLVRLSLDMLNPRWQERTVIAPVVGDLGALALRSKVIKTLKHFSALVPDHPMQEKTRSQFFILLEKIRFSAWEQTYKCTEGQTTRRRLAQVLRLVEELSTYLDSLPEHDETLQARENDQQIPSKIQVICDILDKLRDDLPEHFQQEMDQLWANGVVEIGLDDPKLERVITRSLPRRYRAVRIKAAMMYMSGAISRSIRQGETRMFVDLGTIDEDDLDFDLPYSELNDRKMGHYLGAPALLEWIFYDARWEGKQGDAMLSRMEALAMLLNAEEHPRTGVLAERILDCKGYFHDRARRRFGVIYAAPSSRPFPKGSQCISLTSIIDLKSSSSSPLPLLGDLFSMAFGLAKTVAALHETRWLHKSISSANILVFSPTEDDGYRYVASAVIGAFSYSRPEESDYMSFTPEDSSVLYQHPKYVANDAKFERRFDFYSVGIVLLEIGLWVTMHELYLYGQVRYPGIEEDAETNRVTLLEKYVPQLGGRMGKWYQEAVAFCLDVDARLGWPKDDPEGRWAAQKAFQDNVVDKLARCSA